MQFLHHIYRTSPIDKMGGNLCMFHIGVILTEVIIHKILGHISRLYANESSYCIHAVYTGLSAHDHCQ